MVILEILKVVGIFILCLLAVVIFLCLAILFAPIRYELVLDTIKDFRYSFIAKWLAGFVKVRKKIFSKEIWLCIAGIEIYKLYGSDGEEEEDEDDEKEIEPEESFDDVKIEMGPMDIDIDEKDIEAEKARRERVKKEKEEEERKKQLEEEKKRLAKEKGQSWEPDQEEKEDDTVDKIFQAVDYIKTNFAKKKSNDKTQDKENKPKSNIDRKAQLKELLFGMKCKRGLRHALKELKRLLIWLAPYKVEGNIKYGTGDAASTGLVTGIVSLFPFVYHDELNFYPDFEEKVFMAKCNALGKVRLIYLLKLLLRVYKDEALMYFINVVLNGVENEEGSEEDKQEDKQQEDLNEENKNA